jgi:hypothetical protein
MLVEYCRQQVTIGKIKVTHIDTEENIADILTKNIYNTKLFLKHRDKLLGINTNDPTPSLKTYTTDRPTDR